MTPRQSAGPYMFRIVPLALAFLALAACDQGNGRTAADGEIEVLVTLSEDLAPAMEQAMEAYGEAIEEAVRVMQANLATTSRARRASRKLHSLANSQMHERMLRSVRLARRDAVRLAKHAVATRASGHWSLTISPSLDFGPRSRRPSSDGPLRPRL